MTNSFVIVFTKLYLLVTINTTIDYRQLYKNCTVMPTLFVISGYF